MYYIKYVYTDIQCHSGYQFGPWAIKVELTQRGNVAYKL